MLDIIKSAELESPDNLTYRLDVLADYTTTLEDFDCYDDQETIARYKNGDWYFVTLRVVASKNGIELAKAYLGGVEYGAISRDTWFDIESIKSDYQDYLSDLIAESGSEARNTILELVGA